jgi:2-polyprenyl-3-methyl-5-hydroxy-6-metoxy-1,4-benzoquinol methylase
VSSTQSENIRRVARGIGPLRSTWQFANALRGAIADGSDRNRHRVDREFADPDPWSYATSEAEQECFRHQLAVLDRARPGSRFEEVCEIGCAEGFFTESLEPRCSSLLALDLSEAALARARERRDWGDHVRFARWDLRTDSMQTTYDLVVVAGVLEYFERRSSLRTARDKIVAGVRPGGLLFVVSTRNPGAEEAWWTRAFPRGARINEYVASHPDLRSVAAESGDAYVIDLFRRTE